MANGRLANALNISFSTARNPTLLNELTAGRRFLSFRRLSHVVGGGSVVARPTRFSLSIRVPEFEARAWMLTATETKHAQYTIEH